MNTKPCKCGKLMIERESGMWWCGCGRIEAGENVKETEWSAGELNQWKKANNLNRTK